MFAISLGLGGCAPALPVRPELIAAQSSALELSDALETLIEAGTATTDDREAAYDLARQLPAESAGDAFGRAAIAGRVAEAKGASAVLSSKYSPSTLVAEAEHYALVSRQADPDFRDGAATRMLGMLYVLVPANMLKYGDSEEGLSMLEKLAARLPNVPENWLRLAEAYIALGDKDPAREPLCHALAKKDKLRRDQQALFDKLVNDLGDLSCSGQK